MLDPKELRAGNWVLRVSGIDRDSKSFFEYKPIAANEYLFSSARVSFPILLTPDILGKIGMKHDFGDWFMNIEAEGIDDGLPFLRLRAKDKCWYLKGAKVPAQPVFLHQLQNLVYALSRIELDIQLEPFDNLPFLQSSDHFEYKNGNVVKDVV